MVRHAARPRNSEVDAYAFIKEYLGNHGWVVKNPNRVPDGQVYTQTECLDNIEIQKCLGLSRPENIVKITESEYYVIEAKRNKEQITEALYEAEYDYANTINTSRIIKARMISGVAGNSTDGFIVKSKFLKDGKFKPIQINGKEITGFISPNIARTLLETNTPDISDEPIDEVTFLKTAEEINKKLHIGAINKNQRARVMAALLLSLVDDTRPNIDASPSQLIKEINSRADNVLLRNGKPEFNECIKIMLPPSHDNHIKYKLALVQSIQELENLNIRSAMNSGTDVLGKFYEVFLKYGNGAKEIGIVLTPRHLTRFAADILDIIADDVVYDPTCGTGGFLVAAFDHVKRNATQNDLNYFKQNGLYGVEQEPEVAALAIVNMIFRGDGKNNIVEGNCLQKSLLAINKAGLVSAKFYPNNNLPAVKSPGATKVLMNPPFSLQNSAEKEYEFVQHALNQMRDGGILFSVLPTSTMVEGKTDKYWREHELIENNTLLSVMTLPPELFNPTVNMRTVGIVVKKGIPHPKDQNVLWLRLIKDGFIIKKSKRIPSADEPNYLMEYKNMVKDFITNPSMEITSEPEICKATPINFDDPLFELIPEAYISGKELSQEYIEREIDTQVRELASYLIRAKTNEVV